MPNILVTNDDGILSPGIQALAESLKRLGKVTVVAPSQERSTTGHSLTLHKPI
ncbi:MAG: 5'/3'-nucleotidase SurE, partial [Deltaproteobacteria bacterium]|nr:5'/3'-nucleotidase SurE [Deltaproteobacteria bacterium]